MKTVTTAIGCVLVLVAFACCSGCGQQQASSDARIAQALQEADAMTDSGAELPPAADGALALTSGGAGRQQANRRIIYTADVELVVKDFQEFEQQLPGVIKACDGFVAARKTDRRHGDHRAGTWTIRVPIPQYDALMSGITTLGFATSRNETSQDVTADYVDLQARISNHGKLEGRILEMLDQQNGKLADLLELERELARIREEIERMQGRLRVLTDQTELTTIHLSVREEATYEPPAAPTFGERVASAWTGSLKSIRDVAAALAIAFVAVAPWLIVLGVPASAVAVLVKRSLTKRWRTSQA